MTSGDVANTAGNHRAAEPASAGSALRARLKETTGLYESRRRIGSELPLEDISGQIFDHLIPAMHFPAIASAMIELDGKRFTSENYREGNTNELQADIVAFDQAARAPAGVLSCQYLISTTGRAGTRQRNRGRPGEMA